MMGEKEEDQYGLHHDDGFIKAEVSIARIGTDARGHVYDVVLHVHIQIDHHSIRQLPSFF